MIADTADAIARENIVAYICIAAVLITAIICVTVFTVKTGSWPWTWPPKREDEE